ncbi:septum formation initiator family protein [Streptomyces roseirectus]|uniref:Septum formation initiator family protein n=1 Tax=Streptomyces roseirectus TaxID=2768066 RepID=A0A7H0IK96_9ACTN|nr:septum formation initiator family protein [Streptomyces roseirectus]QNP73212.1 septum formation initiator family protein [Streptomyces roseirectus]
MSGKGELRGRLAGLLPVGGGASAGRTPFVLLVVVLLGGGLIGLLVLNSALSEGAFRMDDLQRETKSLTDEQQALQRDIDAYSAPDALQKRARELGMVPGGDPAFLAPDGTVKGVPSPAAQPSGAHAQEAVRPPEAITLSQTNQGQPGQSQPGQASQPGQTTPSGQTSQSAPIGQPGRPAQPGQAGQPLGRPDQSATQQDLTTGQRTPQTPSAGTPAPSTPGR